MKKIILFLLAFACAGCAHLATTFNPKGTADEIARYGGFQEKVIEAGYFPLQAYTHFRFPGQPLTVYIEGDGMAWLASDRLSQDPTPRHTLVLELAAMDPSPNVAYLARPCQYVYGEHCQTDYWSGKRFSEEVIASMDQAIENLRIQAAANQVHLVGYSGGAAVAVLVAARRPDVASIRTIAGNLDPEAVNRYHRVDSLAGSLDPLDVAFRLTQVPQRHFVGGNDKVVPPFIADSFIEKAGSTRCLSVSTLGDATHSQGWKEQWPSLLKQSVACNS